MKLNEIWQLRGILSTAFRSPNIDDLSKIRINSTEITFPNLNLTPERSRNAELTVATRGMAFINMSLTGFFTQLKNAIIRRPFFGPNGESLWENQGETLTIVGNQNVQKGRIWGISFMVNGTIGAHFNWDSSINYTKGQELNDNGENLPLAHIPPVYGRTKLGFKLDNLAIQSIFRYNMSKDISQFGGTADNPDLATPKGALGWHTWNLYTELTLNNMSFSLGLENILDSHYRLFASGVSAPGRNLIFSVRGNL